MGDHDGLLARVDDWLIAEMPTETADPIVLIRELQVAVGFVKRLRATTVEVEGLRTRLAATLDAARDVIYEWDAGGEWIREQFESALNGLRHVVRVAADTPKADE